MVVAEDVVDVGLIVLVHRQKLCLPVLCLISGKREHIKQTVKVRELAKIQHLSVLNTLGLDDLKQTQAVLLSQLGVSVGLPQLTNGVIHQIIMVIRQDHELHLGAWRAVYNLQEYVQLSTVTNLSTHQIRVHPVLEKLQVPNALIGALKQVRQHRDHLVRCHMRSHRVHRVLNRKHHRDQDGFKLIIVFIHIGRRDIHIRRRQVRIYLNKLNLHIGRNRHKHGFIMHARLNAVAV